MSALYHSGIPKSRGSNRNNYQNYMGNSVNRRNDNYFASQNYNNYYGNPSVAKDPKPASNNQGSHLNYLNSNPKDSGLLPKISQNIDKKDEERKRNLHSRENATRKDENYLTPSLVQSELRRVGDANRDRAGRNKESETAISYLKNMPE